jgi:3-hydroxyacyl-[acyl-carrier-protein] dehydratase
MNDFYQILQTEAEGTRLSVVVRLNVNHAIFRGHFPGSPVLPGVCMIRLVHELMETGMSVQLRMSSADSIKFLTVIDPREISDVSVNIDYTRAENRYTVQASIFSAQFIYFKLKGVFTII